MASTCGDACEHCAYTKQGIEEQEKHLKRIDTHLNLSMMLLNTTNIVRLNNLRKDAVENNTIGKFHVELTDKIGAAGNNETNLTEFKMLLLEYVNYVNQLMT